MNCAVCAEPANSKCGQCGSRAYCSRECQRQDWKGHKTACKKPVASPCKLCHLERGPHTTVVLPCGHAFHGMCVAQLRPAGVCCECDEELSDPPADLYKQAMEMILDRKQHGDEILQLLKEAAAQGHPLSQLRASDILEEDHLMVESEYWLRLAAKHPCIVGINARLKLGILVFKRDLDEAERLFYEGRVFFDGLGPQKHPAINSIHAKLCYYTAQVAVAKNLPENATHYYEKAVSLHSTLVYLEALGAHLYAMGKYAAADPVLRAYVKKNPSNANVLALLGESAVRQGNPAHAWFKRALKADPLHPKAVVFFSLNNF
jgi:tetratricopeptide (TPR) repeat protein